jgi:hypothetical protein
VGEGGGVDAEAFVGELEAGDRCVFGRECVWRVGYLAQQREAIDGFGEARIVGAHEIGLAREPAELSLEVGQNAPKFGSEDGVEEEDDE